MHPLGEALLAFLPKGCDPARGLGWHHLSGYDCHWPPDIASCCAPSSSRVPLVAYGSRQGARDQSKCKCPDGCSQGIPTYCWNHLGISAT